MHLDAQGSEDEMEEDKEMILNAEIDLFLLTSSNKSHNFLNSILVAFHNKKKCYKNTFLPYITKKTANT